MEQLKVDCSNAVIKDDLLQTMGRIEHTYDTAAENIGISRTALINFVLYGTKPNIRTIYKIKSYIKKNVDPGLID